MSESTFSRGKREYGEYVSSRNLENMVKEIKFQYGVLNLIGHMRYIGTSMRFMPHSTGKENIKYTTPAY